MDVQKEISLRNAISYCIENNDANTATNRIMEFIRDEKEAINFIPCCTELPTKETVISEGEKQIVEWLEENDEREKQAYRIGFRRSFEYVLRLMKK